MIFNVQNILFGISGVCIFIVKGQDFPPCPPGFILPAVCGDFCSSDADCSSTNFCCRSSVCSVTCLPRPKPGKCPPFGNQMIGKRCRTDVDCDGIQKCCDGFCSAPNTPRGTNSGTC